jgi:hypothetical protein
MKRHLSASLHSTTQQATFHVPNAGDSTAIWNCFLEQKCLEGAAAIRSENLKKYSRWCSLISRATDSHHFTRYKQRNDQRLTAGFKGSEFKKEKPPADFFLRKVHSVLSIERTIWKQSAGQLLSSTNCLL